MKTRQKTLAILTVFSCLLLAYTGAWFFMASQIRSQIVLLPEQAAKNGITLDGNFSAVTGFPFRPAVHFSGNLRGPRATLVIPDLKAQGFPLPGQSVKLTLPQGAQLTQGTDGKSLDSDLWSAQFISITGIIPAPLPAGTNTPALTAWRAEGGEIVITGFDLKKLTLEVKGRGAATLDDALQPASNLHVEISGYEDFIGYLKRKGLIKPKQGFFVQAALGVLARTNAETGARYLSADLTLQKLALFLGPIEILVLPALQWPP